MEDDPGQREFGQAEAPPGLDRPEGRRADELVLIQITANATRTTEQKRALYRAIVAELTRDPGLRPGNVFINLVEVAAENWSFGEGAMQYGPPI